MSAGRPLVALLGSLAIHGGGGILLVAALAQPASLPPLLVDLIVAVEEAPMPAAGAGGARAPARRAGIGGPRGASAEPAAGAAVAAAPPNAPLDAGNVPVRSPGDAREEVRREAPPPAAEAPSAAPAVEPSTTVLAAPRDREPGSSGAAVGADGSGLAAGFSTARGSGGSGSDVATGAGLRGGEGLALAIPGSGTQGGSGPGGDYAPYLAGLRRRIQDALRYPLPARRRGVTGTVHVELVIEPDGTVARIGVAESSSHRLLDEAALEAVRSVAPEPFPSGLPRRALRVRLPVVFDLR